MTILINTPNGNIGRPLAEALLAAGESLVLIQRDPSKVADLAAQVLFTMKVAPTSGSRNARADEQGVAQVLRQDNKLLVCSYLLRTAAQY